MKRIVSIWIAVGTVLLMAAACKNRESEKRIAELESRLAQLETNKGAATVN